MNEVTEGDEMRTHKEVEVTRAHTELVGGVHKVESREWDW